MKIVRRLSFALGGCVVVAGLAYAVMEIGRLNALIENEKRALRALQKQVDAQAVELLMASNRRATEEITRRLMGTPGGHEVEMKRSPVSIGVDTPPRGYYEQINFVREAVRRILPATGK